MCPTSSSNRTEDLLSGAQAVNSNGNSNSVVGAADAFRTDASGSGVPRSDASGANATGPDFPGQDASEQDASGQDASEAGASAPGGSVSSASSRSPFIRPVSPEAPSDTADPDTTPSRAAPLGFVLTAPRSGGGKTTAALALTLALKRRGLVVRTCKCGPDYVDPTFLAAASGAPCLNVDTWLMGEEGVRSVCARQAKDADVLLVEGVMGLCDGKGTAEGGNSLAGSTLDAARVLNLPLVLVVDAAGLGATIATLVDGFAHRAAREGVALAGIVATRTGSKRHVDILARALSEERLPPLLCALPRRGDVALPSRQLGLVPAAETKELDRVLENLATLASDTGTDRLLARLRSLRAYAHVETQAQSEGEEARASGHASTGAAKDASAGAATGTDEATGTAATPSPAADAADAISVSPASDASAKTAATAAATGEAAFSPASEIAVAPTLLSGGRETHGASPAKRLAVAMDEAFCFYYEDNFRFLQRLGHRLVFFSPLKDRSLPPCDGLYLGGGYPEVHAEALSANASMRASVARAVAGGLPVFAECGGYMYLARELVDTEGRVHPLCGVVDARAVMGSRMRSLGYRQMRFLLSPPFDLDELFGPRPLVRGHEFHWSHMVRDEAAPPFSALYADTELEESSLRVGPFAVPEPDATSSGHRPGSGSGTEPGTDPGSDSGADAGIGFDPGSALPLEAFPYRDTDAIFDSGPVIPAEPGTGSGTGSGTEPGSASGNSTSSLSGGDGTSDLRTDRGRAFGSGCVTGPFGNVRAGYVHLYLPSMERLNALRARPGSFFALSGGARSVLQGSSPQSRLHPQAGDGPLAPRRGVVLVLNGPSSSGKSTLARAFFDLARADNVLRFAHPVRASLDALLAEAGRRTGQVANAPQCFTLEAADARGVFWASAYHDHLAALLSEHDLVVCDHVICGRPEWEADLARTLAGARLFVCDLTCSLNVLLEREAAREDRPSDLGHAHTQALRHSARPVRLRPRLSLDTTSRDPKDLAKELKNWLARQLEEHPDGQRDERHEEKQDG